MMGYVKYYSLANLLCCGLIAVSPPVAEGGAGEGVGSVTPAAVKLTHLLESVGEKVNPSGHAHVKG